MEAGTSSDSAHFTGGGPQGAWSAAERGARLRRGQARGLRAPQPRAEAARRAPRGQSLRRTRVVAARAPAARAPAARVSGRAAACGLPAARGPAAGRLPCAWRYGRVGLPERVQGQVWQPQRALLAWPRRWRPGVRPARRPRAVAAAGPCRGRSRAGRPCVGLCQRCSRVRAGLRRERRAQHRLQVRDRLPGVLRLEAQALQLGCVQLPLQPHLRRRWRVSARRPTAATPLALLVVTSLELLSGGRQALVRFYHLQALCRQAREACRARHLPAHPALVQAAHLCSPRHACPRQRALEARLAPGPAALQLGEVRRPRANTGQHAQTASIYQDAEHIYNDVMAPPPARRGPGLSCQRQSRLPV